MESWFPTFRRLTSSAPRERWTWWPFYTTTTQRMALLRLLAAAQEANAPLIPLLERWSADESGVQQRRLRRLIGLLQAGRALPEALEEVPGILHEEGLLAVRFDSQMGTRTATMRSVLATPTEEADTAKLRLQRAGYYFCTVVPFCLLTIAFTQVVITPRVQRMFAEFHLQPSPYADWPAYFLAPFTAIGGLGLLVVLAVLLVLFATKWGRSLRRATAARYLRSIQNLQAADVLQKLALSIAEGRPLAAALSTLARYHFDPVTRQKLLFVRNEMEQGAEVWHSLVAVKMVTPPEANLLRTTESAANRCWILEQLVQVKRRQTMWRLERFAVFALPAVVLLLAGVVLIQSLSLFDPLIRLIDGLV